MIYFPVTGYIWRVCNMKAESFFMVSGRGQSRTSPLNAFDKALDDAGIAQLNLVKVSSVLPKDCRKIEYNHIDPGEITHCVLARMDGVEGEMISAGVLAGECRSKEGKEDYGLVAEATGNMPLDKLSSRLGEVLGEMADARELVIDGSHVTSESFTVDDGHYGCVVAALIYVF